MVGISDRIPDGIPEKTLSERVFSRLNELVLSNHFRPGDRLLDRDLARLLGVSRTPVREALVRLHQDGLLEIRNGRGYFVVDIGDASHIADLYDLREVLEVHALRLAVERAKPEDIAELGEVLAILDSYRKDPEKRGEEIKIGLRVHEIIARASGNTFLYETVVRLLNRMRFFIWIETLYQDAEAAEATRREHAAFLTLIKEKLADDAEAVVRTHIRTAREHILRIAQLREAFYPPVDLSPIGVVKARGERRAGPRRGRKAATRHQATRARQGSRLERTDPRA